MIKTLRNLFLPEFARLEKRIERLESEVIDTLEDTKTLQEKTFRLHQRLVKRAARDSEKEDRSPQVQPVLQGAEAINARIRERRLRRQHGVPEGVLDAQQRRLTGEGSAAG